MNMLMKTASAAAAALALVSASAVSAAQPVGGQVASQRVSALGTVRANDDLNETNAQGGGFPFLIIFVVIAVGAGLYFAVDDNGDEPTSP